MAQDNQLPEELAQHPEPSPDEMAEFAHWFGVECEVDELAKRIDERRSTPATTQTELDRRDAVVAELTAQRGRLRAGVEGVSTPLPEPTRSEPAEPPTAAPVAPPTPTPEPPSAAVTPPPTTPPKRKRGNALTPLIERAMKEASDPNDHHAVFNILRSWAAESKPPAPIIGYTDGEGVKWTGGDDAVKWLNKAALRKRMGPRKPASGR